MMSKPVQTGSSLESGHTAWWNNYWSEIMSYKQGDDYAEDDREAFLEEQKPSGKLEKYLFIFVILYFGGHLIYAWHTS
jgi:hypothetical protein